MDEKTDKMGLDPVPGGGNASVPPTDKRDTDSPNGDKGNRPSGTDKPKKKSKTLLIVIISVAVLALAGGAVWFGFENGWFKAHRSSGGYGYGGSDSDSVNIDSTNADSAAAMVEMPEKGDTIPEMAEEEMAMAEPGMPAAPGGIVRLEGSGRADKYPIRMKMVIDYDNNLVSGRYAYENTLKKYGDQPQSWFTFKGTVYGNQIEYSAYYQGDLFESFEGALINDTKLMGETVNYNTGDMFTMIVNF